MGLGGKWRQGNETDTLPLWEDGLSQSEQKRPQMKGRKPEKRRKMEQGRSQRTTGSSAKRTEMKAGACWGKANREKNLRNIVQKTERIKKPYKSASYPAAVSETPVHLHQHHTTTDQHQGRRFGVVF